MRFHEIDDAIEAVLNNPECVDPETGEILEAGEVALAGLEGEREATALYLARAVLGEKSEAASVKIRANELAHRARVHERRAESIKLWLTRNLEPGTKWKDGTVAIGWRKSTAVDVMDEKLIPIELCKVKVEPSKSLIGEKLKSGEAVPGARLLHKTNLSIR